MKKFTCCFDLKDLLYFYDTLEPYHGPSFDNSDKLLTMKEYCN